METDQVPESELPPVPEDDDQNATVIEVMTDVEVLLRYVGYGPSHRRGLLRRPSFSGTPTVTFCCVHIHNVVGQET